MTSSQALKAKSNSSNNSSRQTRDKVGRIDQNGLNALMQQSHLIRTMRFSDTIRYQDGPRILWELVVGCNLPLLDRRQIDEQQSPRSHSRQKLLPSMAEGWVAEQNLQRSWPEADDFRAGFEVAKRRTFRHWRTLIHHPVHLDKFL